jgi:hypothetical protein
VHSTNSRLAFDFKTDTTILAAEVRLAHFVPVTSRLQNLKGSYKTFKTY